MSGLRLEIDLGKIGSNNEQLIQRCGARGVSVTAVTKAFLGDPLLGCALNPAAALGDSRIENIERMRSAGIESPMLLLRSPLVSQVERVVSSGAMSVNSEPEVLTALSAAARHAGRIHEVMVMVELGDLREGVMPCHLEATVRHLLGLPSLRLSGLGANLACRNGIEPSDHNMSTLSTLVEETEARFGIEIDVVSGGNSANLDWVLRTENQGRINNLRLGESILLGTEPLGRQPIAGLYTDAIVLVAEVIESQRKPTLPWGSSGQNSFGETPVVDDRGEIWQTIVALGRQDTDPTDLQCEPGVEILAASSDHLVVETPQHVRPGQELRFAPGYSALLRSMTSPFVAKLLSAP